MDDGECFEIDSRLLHLMQYDSTVRIELLELLNLIGSGFSFFLLPTCMFPIRSMLCFFLRLLAKVVCVYPRERICDSCQTKRREVIPAECKCRR